MKRVWIAFLLPIIGAVHAIAFVWLYGHGVGAEALLVLSWLAAFVLYIAALYSSTLFRNSARREIKVAALSVLMSFVSTCIGTMIAIRSYGT
jgi:hypothetical protein